jgi:hypothetical protein
MEPKDLEDLYRVGDSNYLKQMSLTNANIAIQQAKMNFDKALEDYQMHLLSKRINGGGPNLLNRLKDEFESKGVLTIKNYSKLINAQMEYRMGERWKVVNVKESNTTYYFELESRSGPTLEEVTIGLNRVPMAGKRVELYNLWNTTNGNWVGVGKEVIKNVSSLMVRMVELVDEQD